MVTTTGTKSLEEAADMSGLSDVTADKFVTHAQNIANGARSGAQPAEMPQPSSGGNKIGGFLGFAGSAAMMAGWFAEGISKVGKNITNQGKRLDNAPGPLKQLGALIKGTGKAISAPYDYLDARNLGQIAADATEKLHGAVKAATGKELSIDKMNKGGEARLLRMGTGIENTVKKVPGLENLRQRHLGRLQKSERILNAKALEHHGVALEHLDKATQSIKGHGFGELEKILGETKASFAGASALAVEANAAETLEVSKKTVAESIESIKKGSLSKAQKDALSLAERNFNGTSGILGIGKKPGFLAKAGEAHSGFKAAAAKAEAAALRSNFAEGFTKLPGLLSRVKGPAALMAVLYGAGQAATVFSTGKSAADSMHALHDIKKDIGADDNTKLMKEARHQAVMSIIPRTLGGIASLFGFHKLMKGQAALGIAMQVGGPMAADALAANNALIDNYTLIKKAQKQKQIVPAGAYLGLLVHASKKVQAMDQSNPAVMMVAKHYADAKAPVGQVMKEVADGTLDQRLEAASTQVAASQPKPAPAATAEQSAAVVGKHTEAVNNTRRATTAPALTKPSPPLPPNLSLPAALPNIPIRYRYSVPIKLLRFADKNGTMARMTAFRSTTQLSGFA